MYITTALPDVYSKGGHAPCFSSRPDCCLWWWYKPSVRNQPLGLIALFLILWYVVQQVLVLLPRRGVCVGVRAGAALLGVCAFCGPVNHSSGHLVAPLWRAALSPAPEVSHVVSVRVGRSRGRGVPAMPLPLLLPPPSSCVGILVKGWVGGPQGRGSGLNSAAHTALLGEEEEEEERRRSHLLLLLLPSPPLLLLAIHSFTSCATYRHDCMLKRYYWEATRCLVKMTKVQFPDSYAGALSQCSQNHPTPAAAAGGWPTLLGAWVPLTPSHSS